MVAPKHGLRARNDIWYGFTSSAKAAGYYPGNVIEALLIRWGRMAPSERAKLMSERERWIAEQKVKD